MNNVQIIDNNVKATYHSGIMGTGEAVVRVRVTEPGNGFPHIGIWDLVRWSNAKNCIDGVNFDDAPYASAPVYIGEMAYLIVQLGYTVFGASPSYEGAIKDAAQWVSDPETGMQGTTEEKLKEMLTPEHEACDGDLVMTYDVLPENASSMDGDELYELIEQKETAEKISALFDGDGTRFAMEDGTTLSDVCVEYGGEVDRDGDLWRYEFEDGSAITGGAEGWDIEGTRYFSMVGAESESGMKSKFEVWEDNGQKFFVEACDMDEALDEGARRLGCIDYADMAEECGWGENEGLNIRKVIEEELEFN